MATYEKGILGGFSGKVGNVVGARWRGKDIMRSVPVRGAYTPTFEQMQQQEKFTAVMRFLTPIKPIVGTYFGQKRGDKSIFNLATSYHLLEALRDDHGTWAIDYTKVLISKGELRGLSGATVTPEAGHVIKLDWDDNSGQGFSNATDGLMVVVYNEGLNVYQLFETIAQRNATTASITLPAFLSGQELEVWASFATVDGKYAATSSYLGAVTIS